ncbi:hypothetical protein LRP30_06990 [Bradyrhizobium sp. C-145]|uniref:hypothetical protein n=1 Tax=Bradyrhizobium sp. C-145 TaxID=574727 RepID=UPI00201B6807|nr:hypothetical protein [Bradyrhizobium sp. C-145]UQR65007.1 hypothetical protein LRP30_06990 [Bradyrhizobium sp. C-145]
MEAEDDPSPLALEMVLWRTRAVKLVNDAQVHAIRFGEGSDVRAGEGRLPGAWKKGLM